MSEQARPLVARQTSNRAVWLFGAALALAAIGLFAALEAKRSALSSPAISEPRATAGGAFAPPPELIIPPDYGAQDAGMTSTTLTPLLPSVPPDAALAPSSLRVARRPVPDATDAEPALTRPPRETYTIDPQPEYRTVLRRPQAPVAATPIADPDRKRATRFLNPAATVPKGTVIHAVLETALNSTRAGAARAVVSRDVSGFDGTRVLIPKGSKLIGDYEADLAPGQNRALIQWTRLMLPDGTIIDIDSPSADALGRAGVKGSVNSHFLERFGGAILQSALDIGVQLATREVAGNTVIVALPGSAQTQVTKPDDVKPTLKIRHGSSVSVFVARDLDFSDMGQ